LVPLRIIGWKDPRDLLDVLERIKYSCPYWDSNPEPFNSKCSHDIDYATLSPSYKTLKESTCFYFYKAFNPFMKEK
jgi:hypothetical protein